ncbi:hypothetical protein BaRGS_00029227, partial [Batillaria attramentaria]
MAGTMTETISDTVCLIEGGARTSVKHSATRPKERTLKTFPPPGYRLDGGSKSPTAGRSQTQERVSDDNTRLTRQFVSTGAGGGDPGGSGDPQEPLTGELIFSDNFQFTGEFSSAGGILQGDSDVKLVVPENAIPRKKKITIGGAVCVDLDTVHTRLGLKDKEFICSPVIEYVTNEKGFRFQKPVQIDLPRFQPHLCSAKSITVYRCNKQDNGEITKEKLKKQKDSTQSDGTYFLSEDGVHVLTSHFTSIMTTVRRKRCAICLAPPEIHMWMCGKYIQDDRDQSFVEIKLSVSDDRSTIRDFRKAFGLTEDDERRIIDKKVVPKPRRELFRARLLLENGEQWTFSPSSPPEWTRDIYEEASSFHSFDWYLTPKPEHAPRPRFKGVLEAGYVSRSTRAVERPEVMHINIEATKPSGRQDQPPPLSDGPGTPGISGTGQT